MNWLFFCFCKDSRAQCCLKHSYFFNSYISSTLFDLLLLSQLCGSLVYVPGAPYARIRCEKSFFEDLS